MRLLRLIRIHLQWRRLHRARGHVRAPQMARQMAGHGLEEQQTRNCTDHREGAHQND